MPCHSHSIPGYPHIEFMVCDAMPPGKIMAFSVPKDWRRYVGETQQQALERIVRERRVTVINIGKNNE